MKFFVIVTALHLLSAAADCGSGAISCVSETDETSLVQLKANFTRRNNPSGTEKARQDTPPDLGKNATLFIGNGGHSSGRSGEPDPPDEPYGDRPVSDGGGNRPHDSAAVTLDSEAGSASDDFEADSEEEEEESAAVTLESEGGSASDDFEAGSEEEKEVEEEDEEEEDEEEGEEEGEGEEEVEEEGDDEEEEEEEEEEEGRDDRDSAAVTLDSEADSTSVDSKAGSAPESRPARKRQSRKKKSRRGKGSRRGRKSRRGKGSRKKRRGGKLTAKIVRSKNMLKGKIGGHKFQLKFGRR